MLDPTIDIAFFGVSYGSEFMFLLHNAREVPKLWRASHIFRFKRIVHRFHMFEGFRCTFEFLVLSFFARQHAVSNDGIFDVLVHCLIDMLQQLHSFFDRFIFEVFVTVVLPNPIAAQLFDFQFEGTLFLLLHLAEFGLHLRVLSQSERLFGSTRVDIESGGVSNF